MTISSAPPSAKYTNVAIALHWIIAVLVLFLLFPGEDLIKVHRGESLAGWGPTAHASLGILVLILSLVRIVWRISHPAPQLPPMPTWQVKATAALHGMLYVLTILIPLFGWMALAPYGAERIDTQAITFFKLLPLDLWPNLGEWTGEFHELTGNLAMLLIALHVLAALKHQFIDKDGLIRRMTFR